MSLITNMTYAAFKEALATQTLEQMPFEKMVVSFPFSDVRIVKRNTDAGVRYDLSKGTSHRPSKSAEDVQQLNYGNGTALFIALLQGLGLPTGRKILGPAYQDELTKALSNLTGEQVLAALESVARLPVNQVGQSHAEREENRTQGPPSKG